jgi:polar amino acid transport system substrate-binding protein
LLQAWLLQAWRSSAPPLTPTTAFRPVRCARPTSPPILSRHSRIPGPASCAAPARELARRLDAPVKITGVASPAAVIDSVRNGEADIGFIAFDPQRAAELDFSQVYALAQNTYLVREDSPLKTVADIDRAGVKVGVTARDTADLVLTRTLKAAGIRRNSTGSVDTAVTWLADGTVDAYGTNRQRLTELAARHAGYRLLPDNFYGVPQSVVAAKGNTAMIDFVNAVLDDAKRDGLIARSIAQAGLHGLDVAPPRREKQE